MSAVHIEHVQVLNWALSRLFVFACLNWQGVSVRSGAGGHEGELGSVFVHLCEMKETTTEDSHRALEKMLGLLLKIEGFCR